jgi:hypothetical protein
MPEAADRGSLQIPLHRFWWLHDARWYQGVRKRYGQEAANEINAEAMLFVARRVSTWYTQVHRLDFPTLPPDEFIKWFTELSRIMWTEQMTTVEHEFVDADVLETVVTEHFAVGMLRAAKSLADYRCPCLNMRAGFFAGMRLKASDELVECQTRGADVCRFRAVLDRPGPDAGS